MFIEQKHSTRFEPICESPSADPDVKHAVDFVRVIPTTAEKIRRAEEEMHAQCALSSVNCAAGIVLQENNLVAAGRLGYKTVRGTKGVMGSGEDVFFEVTCLRLGNTGAVRIGVQTQWANIQGPVGMDKHGYGICSCNGDGVVDSVRRPLGVSFSEDDVVGVRVKFAENRPLPRTREAVTWGRRTFWKEELPPTPTSMAGSFVEFFVNGVRQGRMSICEGTYHPAISLFSLPSEEEPVLVRASFNSGRLTYAHGCKPWIEATEN